jgi:hypothetical protein
MLSRLSGKNHDNGNLSITADDAHYPAFSGEAERDFRVFRYEVDAFSDTAFRKIFFKFIVNEQGGATLGEIAQLAHHLPVFKEESPKKKRDIKAGFVLDEFNAGRFSSVHLMVCSFCAIYHLTMTIKMQILFHIWIKKAVSNQNERAGMIVCAFDGVMQNVVSGYFL